MPMLLALSLIAQSGVVATGRPAPFVGSKKIHVGKSQYRVEIKDDGRVLVAPKSIILYASERRLDEMHEAVKRLTGCEMIRPVYMGNTVRGTLQCQVPSANAPEPR